MDVSDKHLSELSPVELQKYGMRHASHFDYRVELARRIAVAFKADHLIMLDDVAFTVSQSQRATNFLALQVRVVIHRRLVVFLSSDNPCVRLGL